MNVKCIKNEEIITAVIITKIIPTTVIIAIIIIIMIIMTIKICSRIKNLKQKIFKTEQKNFK